MPSPLAQLSGLEAALQNCASTVLRAVNAVLADPARQEVLRLLADTLADETKW